MPITYKIKTINDMVTKIPPEALPRFLEELPVILAATALIYYQHTNGVPPEKIQDHEFFPEMEWIDDGKDSVEIRLTNPSKA